MVVESMAKKSRPVTATKSFALSSFSNATFRPFTIGKSSPHSSQSSPHEALETPQVDQGVAKQETRRPIKTSHAKKKSQSASKPRDRSTPKSPLPLPYRPTTASKMSNRSPSAHLIHSPIPPGKAGRLSQKPDSHSERASPVQKAHKQKQEKTPSSNKDRVTESAADTHDSQEARGSISGYSDAIWDRFKRPKVPHDYHIGRYSHSHYCTEFPFPQVLVTGHPATLPSSMITKNVAFSSRHARTTFGKSNRIDFLRNVYERVGPSSIRPLYPAAYHGTGGEGKEYALGLSVAGSAGDERILRTTYTYGDTAKIPNRKFPEPRLPEIKTTEMKKVVPVKHDPEAPRHVRDVMQFNGGHWDKVHIDYPKLEKSKTINTRYGSNAEWTRPTKVTVQSFPESHFFMSETDRLAHLPYVDDKPEKQHAYQLKLRNFVRDKNINTVHDLMRLEHLTV